MKATPQPCKECPFKRTSLPGWLGPWPSPEYLLQYALGELGFPCHMRMGKAPHPICSGSLICANKSVKRFRNPELARLQDAAPASEKVLNAQEFCEHHHFLGRKIGRAK